MRTPSWFVLLSGLLSTNPTIHKKLFGGPTSTVVEGHVHCSSLGQGQKLRMISNVFQCYHHAIRKCHIVLLGALQNCLCTLEINLGEVLQHWIIEPNENICHVIKLAQAV